MFSVALIGPDGAANRPSARASESALFPFKLFTWGITSKLLTSPCPPPASSGISKDAAAIEMLKDRERKANYRDQWTPEKCRWDKCMGGGPARQFWPRNGIDNCCPGSIRRRGTSFCTIDIFYSTSLSMGSTAMSGLSRASAPRILTRLYPSQACDLPDAPAEVSSPAREERL